MARRRAPRLLVLAIGVTAVCGSLAASSEAAWAATSYRSGTYSADGSYASPAGRETIKVKLTIASNKVKSVKVTGVNIDPEAQQYESAFAKGISKAVVGKKLSTLTVSRVAGSSLTGAGFNAAVATIRAHAKK